MSWQVSITEGEAGAFHRRVPAVDTPARVWVRRLTRPALVLGSTQPDALVRDERARADGIEVCRRRSGGGLVYLDPATDCWIDLIVPRDSALWHHDVGLAFHWVGEHWASTLAPLLQPHPPAGPDGPDGVSDSVGRSSLRPRPIVHRGSTRGAAAGSVWCFAELGHGEVSLGGSKVVGLSQRRTRTWLRIQTLVVGDWPAQRLAGYVDPDRMAALDPARYGDAAAFDPTLVAAGFPAGLTRPDPVVLAERFVGMLPPP